VHLFSSNIFLLFLSYFSTYKKKMGEKMRNFIYFFFLLLIAFQILHVFLPDISVHCPLCID
jgi:hypothetical protein